MSIYDYRDKPAYGNFVVERSYSKNPHILKWWTPEHDHLIVEQIEKEHWLWYWGITDKIVAVTHPKILEAWRKEDHLCSRYAWYNILMYFAASRAERLGLTKQIREPRWKTCPLCNNDFVENSLPGPLVKRLEFDHLDFCAPCLRDTVLQGSGRDSLTKEQILTYLRDLSSALQRVPNQNYGEGIADLHGLDFQERLAILQLLEQKPAVRRVKELFGSWLKALIEAEVLEDGTRRTSRGTQCIAKDGHVCLSLGEKTIDDFLYSHGIAHDKEPRYPEGNFRGDFSVNGIFIEYFGLKGDPDYDAKTRLKQRICKKHIIRLISIYPSDLVSLNKLQKKLFEMLSPSN